MVRDETAGVCPPDPRIVQMHTKPFFTALHVPCRPDAPTVRTAFRPCHCQQLLVLLLTLWMGGPWPWLVFGYMVFVALTPDLLANPAVRLCPALRPDPHRHPGRQTCAGEHGPQLERPPSVLHGHHAERGAPFPPPRPSGAPLSRSAAAARCTVSAVASARCLPHCHVSANMAQTDDTTARQSRRLAGVTSPWPRTMALCLPN